jgi:hypothetical protein
MTFHSIDFSNNPILGISVFTYLSSCGASKVDCRFTIELNKQGKANMMALPFLSSYYPSVYFLNFLINNPSPSNPEPMYFEGKHYIVRKDER